jgi:endonuclease III
MSVQLRTVNFELQRLHDRDVLLSFAGVGPKCANLVLGVACGTPVISVDIHVHRVAGRWESAKVFDLSDA